MITKKQIYCSCGAEGPDIVSRKSILSHPNLTLQNTRMRMQKKFLVNGVGVLDDRDLLEMILSSTLCDEDVTLTADRLINRFGDLANILSSSEQDLGKIPGLGTSARSAIKIIQASAILLIRSRITDRPILNNWNLLMDYLNAVMARQPIEQFRVLFLNDRNILIADEVQAYGTANHVPVYPRQIMKRALELDSTALILVHNHPSGDPAPSSDDIEMTLEVKRAASALSIELHDHIIVGSGCWLSFRRENLLQRM